MRSVIVISFILAFALVKNPEIDAASRNYFRYKVRPGDTLSEIAQRFKVSQRRLQRMNNIRKRNQLYAGRRIKVPRAGAPRAERTIRSKINLSWPLRHRRLVKGFRPMGDSRNYGLLYRTRRGQPIKAAAAGRVIKVASMRGFGRYILVDHGRGWISMYSNLSDIYVKSGQSLGRASKIATSGGRRFFFLLSYKGKPVNPIRYL